MQNGKTTSLPAAGHAPADRASAPASLMERLNTSWHRPAMLAFLLVVLAHWAEHLVQAYQVWALGMPRHHALGALGMLYPWLVHSEWLHYGYALVMLAGLLALRPAMVGRARRWWTIALAIQFWHHLEHALLLAQALTGRNLAGAAAPTSLVQLLVPRIELHLFYNGVVFVPMVIAMAYHLRPSPEEARAMKCGCGTHRATAAA
jgi:hypothetical protein